MNDTGQYRWRIQLAVVALLFIGAVLQAEIGAGPVPTLTTSSAGVTRTWTRIDDFVQEEVAEARICAGLHCRTSTEVALVMGKQIGALVVAKFPPSDK